MTADDQSAVIELLASPATHGGVPVERIDTHTAIVFLAGERAYKLKRAVRFDYLDFSTADRRRTCCEAELRLNQRTAPTIYRRVGAVTSEADGTLALDGRGSAVDWLVEMNRFPQEALFDRLAGAGRLDLALMPPLADAIVAFHAAADRRHDHGGAAGMRWVVEGNATGFAEFGAGCLEWSAWRQLTDNARREVNRQAALLDARREAGQVRQCHGDLHLRNIVLVDGRPTLFDGVEFNDEIACTDVHYDLAFLLMDLWRRCLPRHANAIWNRYLAGTEDWQGISLLPLFLSCRAAVRAKTTATTTRVERDPARRTALEALARQYLTMAEDVLHPPRPSIIAIGGFSGSGKSTLALALAPSVGAVPGAIVLRSDEIRKQLCGVPALERLGPDGYADGVSRRVYQALLGRAAAIVGAGHTVIVDAVYARPHDRAAIERVAVDASVPFAGIWLDAPEQTLVARVTARHDDPSDADADVIRTQRLLGTGPIAWRRFDASISRERLLPAAESLVNELPVTVAKQSLG
jgi:aminoglycoside phosphotransferase family enzyme/predicted kinase